MHVSATPFPPPRQTWRSPLLAAAAVALCAATSSALAGVTYTLDRPAAAPGDTVRLQAVYFNDGGTSVRWNAPRQLVLQWRSATGVMRTVATLPGEPAILTIPVNNFARVAWDVVVPAQARGMQAVSVEGEPALLALEATGHDDGRSIAMAPANVPVVDARTGRPLSDAQVTAAGASPASGPAPEAAVAGRAPVDHNSGFDSFRSALSAYQPSYFVVGTRERTSARFQLSAKYRLFTPPSDRPATFAENLYLGYTQTSLWDLEGDSKPFIDTTFNPSFFWLKDDVWQSANQDWRIGVNAGVEHMSNGKDGPDSRSINDGYIQPSLHYRFDSGSTLSFGPKIKGYFGKASENKDYTDYAGYVDWNVRWAQDNGPVLSAMYRQGDKRRRTTQVDFAWPLRSWFDMNGYVHLQYFNGYGETLLGYNERNKSQFRIGVSIVP